MLCRDLAEVVRRHGLGSVEEQDAPLRLLEWIESLAALQARNAELEAERAAVRTALGGLRDEVTTVEGANVIGEALRAYVEVEAACCPEDVGFDEHIADQRRSIDTLKATAASQAERIGELEAACGRLHHWHDWGKDNEGMVVSAEVVREIWALATRSTSTGK